MTDLAHAAANEEELDMLVSFAIRRAELLTEQGPTMANGARAAWAEVQLYEERLADLTKADDLFGGVARVGAISAALAAGQDEVAMRLKERYLSDISLPEERRKAIDRAFEQHFARQAARYPHAAKSRPNFVAELVEWRRLSASNAVFPLPA